MARILIGGLIVAIVAALVFFLYSSSYRTRNEAQEQQTACNAERADTRDDAVPTSAGQPAREQLEDRAPVSRTRVDGGLEHGQLVLVGQQSSRRAGGVGHGLTLLM